MAVDLRSGIAEAAQALGMDPVDLATIIHYESGFDPNVWGGKNNQHYGLIQFGPNERKNYGVAVGDPASQLGAKGAIVRYFQDRGWKPGMSFEDAYSIVNAGSPGRASASDASSGGQPGTVRDKVTNQMADDRAKAVELLKGSSASYDPRLDTPSTGKPVGSELPGPPPSAMPSQYDLPDSKGGFDIAELREALEDKMTPAEHLGEGLMKTQMPTGGFDYKVPPVQPAALAAAQPAPMINPQQAAAKREGLAAMMARLNAPAEAQAAQAAQAAMFAKALKGLG